MRLLSLFALGGTGELVVHSVKVKTITDMRSWLSREKLVCGSTTARLAAGMSKRTEGTGSESVLLADWTSIHLDVIARDRGLKRLAASLYALAI